MQKTIRESIVFFVMQSSLCGEMNHLLFHHIVVAFEQYAKLLASKVGVQ